MAKNNVEKNADAGKTQTTHTHIHVFYRFYMYYSVGVAALMIDYYSEKRERERPSR